MGHSWSREEDETLVSLMNYVPGREVPIHPALSSWKHVAIHMNFLYLEQGRDRPRHYTDEIVSARWNQNIRPQLLAALCAPLFHFEVPSPPLNKEPPLYEEEALPPYEKTQGRPGGMQKRAG